MTLSVQTRLMLCWVGLCAITLLAWLIGAHHSPGALTPDAAVAFSAFAITAIKVRIILREFMELKHAPALLRYMSDGLLALFVLALGLAYTL